MFILHCHPFPLPIRGLQCSETPENRDNILFLVQTLYLQQMHFDITKEINTSLSRAPMDTTEQLLECVGPEIRSFKYCDDAESSLTLAIPPGSCTVKVNTVIPTIDI